MALVLIVGTDPAVLEGIAQALAVAGHEVRTSADAHNATRPRAPLVVVLERDAAATIAALALAPGGAVVLYRTGTAAGGSRPLTSALRRATIAELALPLERNRLLALVRHVAERAQQTGRGDLSDVPEQRAP